VKDWSFLRADLETMDVFKESIPSEWKGLGGRALTSMVIKEKVPPTCSPLGPDNLLVFAPGILAGCGASSSDRLSVGGKSPLTGGIKESNVGGKAGLAFVRLGIRCLIISGRASTWKIAHISRAGIRFEIADDLVGLEIYAATAKLRDRYGSNTAILTIGPAGEMLLAAGNIGVGDIEGIPARHAGRGGMGAVMGSKRLKAIVIDPTGGEPPAFFDSEALQAANRRFSKALLEHPVSGKSMPIYGTSVMVNNINALGGLPTRNFSEGSFEFAERISGEALHDLILERDGKTTHGCMPGCVVRCSNILPNKNGQELTRAFEYESIVLLGSNCGISDLDAIGCLNHRCDELGLDTMEIGVAIGVAMEADLASFGDFEAALKLIDEVATGSALGRVLGSGAAVTGKVFGVSRIPVVMGQAISAYDPRSLKGTGVTYATSPMGADHTAGNALPGSTLPDGTKPDPAKSENQVQLSRYLQHLAMTFDSLGLCWFTRGPILADPSLLMDILHALKGGSWTMEKLLEQAGETLQVELAFNRAAGLGEQHDLPYFFRTEPLGMQGRVFDIPVQEMNRTLKSS
jgi:aldehyde:ferredoxin oxidoreductase